MEFAKYSIGIGDRFGRQAGAQLDAITEAKSMGIDIVKLHHKPLKHDLLSPLFLSYCSHMCSA